MKNFSLYCDFLDDYIKKKEVVFHAICNVLSDFNDRKTKMRLRGFNDFNYIDLLRGYYDENTHSKIIAELLNPSGKHYQGSIFLDNFFEAIGLNIIKDNFKVDIERFIDCKNTDNYERYQGRIDIFLESDNHFIILENKIDAGEQELQIKKYIECVKREKHISEPDKLIVVYLTKNGNDPSRYSLGDFRIFGNYIYDSNHNKIAKYINISYEKEILDWLDKNVSDVENISNLREILLQYIRAVNKITSREENRMNLKDFLLSGENKALLIDLIENYNDFKEFVKNGNNIECRKIIEEENLDDILNSRSNGIKYELRLRAVNKMVTILEDYSKNHGFKIDINDFLIGSKWSPVNIYKMDWLDENGEALLTFSIENGQYDFWGDFYYGIRKSSENKPYKNKNFNSNILTDIVKRNNMKTSNWWLLWKNFRLPMYKDEFCIEVLKRGEEEVAREYVSEFTNFIEKNVDLVEKYIRECTRK